MISVATVHLYFIICVQNINLHSWFRNNIEEEIHKNDEDVVFKRMETLQLQNNDDQYYDDDFENSEHNDSINVDVEVSS